jgi:uncharacterized protein YndB with AHSA1/START domain
MNTKGKVTREADGFKVVFERVLNHTVEKVWDATSNPDKLKVWWIGQSSYVIYFGKGTPRIL